jgi:signal transduction histidine kinase
MGHRACHLAIALAVSCAITLAVVQDITRSDRALPVLLAMGTVWLVSLAVLVVADRCAAASRPAAGWSLTLALAAGWAPFLAGRTWVWSALDMVLLAAAALLPVFLVVHGLAWSSHSQRFGSGLVAIPAVAAAVTAALFYAPLGDPLCTRGCWSGSAPWADPRNAPAVVVTVATLTGTAAVLGLLTLLRARSRLVYPVMLSSAAGLAVVLMLAWLRGTAWGLTPGPPAQATWTVLPAALAAAGSGRYLWVVRSARLRLRAMATGLERSEHHPLGRLVHFALPDGGGWVDREGRAVEEEPARDQAPLLRDVAGRPWVRFMPTPKQSHLPVLPAWDVADLLHLETAGQTALLRADQRDVQESRRRIVARSDAERRTVERDLHDGVQQRLVSAQLQLALARSVAPPEVETELRATQERTQRALARLREISRGLYPRSLLTNGLPAALHELAVQRPFHQTLTGPVQSLPLDARTTVYAVVHRLLEPETNRSGCASQPHVKVEVAAERVRLRVTMSGITRDDVAMTLVEVEDRVGATAGRLTVTKTDDGSLDVEVFLPCAW